MVQLQDEIAAMKTEVTELRANSCVSSNKDHDQVLIEIREDVKGGSCYPPEGV